MIVKLISMLKQRVNFRLMRLIRVIGTRTTDNKWNRLPSTGVVVDVHSFVSMTSSSDRIIIWLFFPSRSSSHLASSSSPSLSLACLWFLPYNCVFDVCEDVTGSCLLMLILFTICLTLGIKLKLDVMQSKLKTTRIETIDKDDKYPLIESDWSQNDAPLTRGGKLNCNECPRKPL